MQTFLPYTNTVEVARSLDSKRLNKQILECYQILNVLSGMSKSGAWRNHPAVLMWRGFEKGLWGYVTAMVEEAALRGIKTENNVNNLNALKEKCWEDWGDTPPSFWLDEHQVMRLITTHKANLFRKDPIYYAHFQYAVNSPYNAPCCDKCQYFWVTHWERDNARN